MLLFQPFIQLCWWWHLWPFWCHQGTGRECQPVGRSYHEIQLSWTGPEELKQANYTLQSLPKGLRFLRVVPTLESPKVMGLMGIHDPDALWHYAGYTYCPWCSKEGQNEGMVVNHLRTTHYRLGLVCGKCFGCPSVMLDSLCQHGCQDCLHYNVPSGLGPSDWPSFQTKGSYKGVKVVLFNQTPFPWGRPEDSTKKAPPTNQQNSYFLLRCGQICLRTMWLIMLSTLTWIDCS